jgi:hypothetical protein
MSIFGASPNMSTTGSLLTMHAMSIASVFFPTLSGPVIK